MEIFLVYPKSRKRMFLVFPHLLRVVLLEKSGMANLIKISSVILSACIYHILLLTNMWAKSPQIDRTLLPDLLVDFTVFILSVTPVLLFTFRVKSVDQIRQDVKVVKHTRSFQVSFIDAYVFQVRTFLNSVKYFTSVMKMAFSKQETKNKRKNSASHVKTTQLPKGYAPPRRASKCHSFSKSLQRDRDEQEKYREEVKSSYNGIQFSTNELENLVSDLREYQKIETSGLTVRKSDTNVREVLMDVIQSERNIHDKVGVEITSDFHFVPDYVLTDRNRIRQVFRNIIGNALKYTQEGSIHIALSFDHPNSEIVFTCKDTGIGIPSDKLGLVFTPFNKVNKQKNIASLGLGMMITRELSLKLDGSINVTSPGLGKGTTVVFRSKCIEVFQRKKHENSIETLFAEKKLGTNYPLSILVVDDHMICTKIMKHLLCVRCGYEHVEFAGNGMLALNMCEHNIYDVAFVDLVLGRDMSGAVLMNEMKLRGHKFPIFAVTASRISGNFREEHEIAGVIFKPIQSNQIKAALLKAFGMKKVHTSPTKKFFNVKANLTRKKRNSLPAHALGGQLENFKKFRHKRRHRQFVCKERRLSEEDDAPEVGNVENSVDMNFITRCVSKLLSWKYPLIFNVFRVLLYIDIPVIIILGIFANIDFLLCSFLFVPQMMLRVQRNRRYIALISSFVVNLLLIFGYDTSIRGGVASAMLFLSTSVFSLIEFCARRATLKHILIIVLCVVMFAVIEILNFNEFINQSPEINDSDLIVVLSSVIYQILCVFLYISPMVASENSLNLEIECLKAKNWNLCLLIAKTGHDMRSPVSCIQFFLNNLSEFSTIHHLANHLKIVNHSMDGIQDITNSVVDFFRVKNSKLTIFYTTGLDIRGTIKSMIGAAGLKKSVKVKFDNVPSRLTTDLRLVRKIIRTLIYFGENNKTEPYVLRKRDVPDEKKILCSYQDSKHLMTICAEVKGNYVHTMDLRDLENPVEDEIFCGMSLGLYLSRKFCELLNGSFRMIDKSSENRIVILLSFEALVSPVSPKKVHNVPSRKMKTIERNHVLIVEDNVILQKVMKKILNKLNFSDDEIETTETGEETIKLIMKNKYDLVFLDYFLSDVTAIDVMQELRQNSKANEIIADTTFVLCTGRSDITNAEQENIRNLGIVECLFKPIREDDIRRVINENL